MTKRETMTAYRVALVNAAGRTSGPMFSDRATQWTPNVDATCQQHDAPPAEDCLCGVYGVETPGALAPVIRSATELLDAATRGGHAPGGPWPHTVVTAQGRLALAHPRTVVILLRGILHDAMPSGTAPLDELLPVTRAQLMTPAEVLRAGDNPAEPLDEVLFHAFPDYHDPAGTWRGARFVAETVRAVRPAPPWLADVLAPLPIEVEHIEAGPQPRLGHFPGVNRAQRRAMTRGRRKQRTTA